MRHLTGPGVFAYAQKIGVSSMKRFLSINFIGHRLKKNT